MAELATPKTIVSLHLHNHQRTVLLPIRAIENRWREAILLLPKSRVLLPEQIDIHLVNKREICRIHAEHLQDATPTDVITFPYGEVFICPAVACDQAKDFKTSVAQEVLLYGIHALLHLQGRRDDTPKGFSSMARDQEAIMCKLKPLSRAG